MPHSSDLEQIKQVLLVGRLTVLDSATGYQRSLYASCPTDDHDSPVYRTEKSGEAITRVVFRCPICSGQFDVTPEHMFLR